jgi:xanthine dehydrogenase accessory factor
MHIHPVRIIDDQTPIVLLLGTGDIASAIGRELFKAGWGVVMLHDPAVPVLRRGMAFDDALEDGVAELDGVWGVRAQAPEMLSTLARSREAVVLARLDLAVVAAACHGMASVLIDARMRKYAAPADLRPLAPCAIGIGPGFIAEGNVDIAIETLPGQEGDLVVHGPTAVPTGRSVPLGGAGEERFAYALAAGPWQPRVALGTWVEAGAAIGCLGQRKVLAPIEGCVRGMVRATPNGIARGAKLAEIDPRPGAPWSGVPPRAQRIATGVQRALAALLPVRSVPAEA